ncbi:alpha/beta hydrolase [Rhodoblastus acidophilus]|uniref:Alpha/beta hydrolase n=1 Tax=Candidatus Rhodoblastus alkanivorans TaxID=2954117 RepID=A0ABS9Z6X8_9HYPH|nr:alpha/beta hydrolase [Candidatus Rhodoblastus alkanivorans]MCI4679604.1 alpha/beta hydrolase [Candidatus Rhodoblastus alkanivorans]MCI4683429.1 alpha/beta hydrolase [Candidatus Rhodoblastus alkanivorans]MDI4640739.1 alpha/beta hydrolase [Rhodoblastus acidophilus]
MRAYLLVLILPALLAACARPGVDPMYPPVAARAPGATDHTILIATTRKRSPDPGAMFSGERGKGIEYAEAVVSVPPTHVSGNIEWPSQRPGNPNTDFVTRESSYLDSEKAFVAAVNQQLAQRPPGHRDVMLFVHGYNTLFPEGLYRLAQVAHDSKAQGVPVYFSWASRGELAGYVYDQNSATIARDALEHILVLLAKSNAEKINVLAHSMGNWVTVEAFRNIAMTREFRGYGHKLGAIILASPDIDVDVFRSQMARIGTPKKPFLIVLSRDDRALAVSRFIAGDKSRLGDYKHAANLTKYNAIVVDLSDVKGENPLNHDKFAEIAKIAPQLRQVLAEGVGKKGSVDQLNPVEDAPGVVKTALTLPIAMVAAPIVIIARQAQ